MIRGEIPGLSPVQSQSMVDLFAAEPLVTRATLFGSRAKGGFREGSDIDVVLQGEGLTHQIRDRILESYEELFMPWKLDLLLDAALVDPALREHVARVGRVIYSR